MTRPSTSLPIIKSFGLLSNDRFSVRAPVRTGFVGTPAFSDTAATVRRSSPQQPRARSAQHRDRGRHECSWHHQVVPGRVSEVRTQVPRPWNTSSVPSAKARWPDSCRSSACNSSPVRMSAPGHERRIRIVRNNSAWPPIADLSD